MLNVLTYKFLVGFVLFKISGDSAYMFISILIVSDCTEQQLWLYHYIVCINYRVSDFVFFKAKNLIFKVSMRWPSFKVDLTNVFMAAPTI